MNVTVCEYIMEGRRGKERVIWQEFYRVTTVMNRGWMGPNNKM
jgi:hypothetical protein